jgi:hypothetical protein
MNKKRAQKLSFVVPLASKAASGNWSRSCQLLEMGLRSFLALPLENTEIFVVGHDVPSQCGLIDHQRVKFVTADCSGPDLNLKADDLIRAKAEDKGKKVELGTKMAHASGSEWVMFCDADDLVSNKLPQNCNFESTDAIVLGIGWQWSFGASNMVRRANFDRICGTSALMRLTKKNFPMWIGGSCYRVAEQGHNVRVNALKEAGAVVQMLRRPLAVYTVNNGSNYYYDPQEGVNDPIVRRILRFAKRRINTYRLTESLRDEFAIPGQIGSSSL